MAASCWALAGALKQALPLLGDEFFVLNGDSYLPCSFARIQSAYEAARASGPDDRPAQ